MPFTPFHMGPGLAIKAIAGRRFSLSVFGFAQVAIDLEPLIRMIRGDILLHGHSHTWLGALVIGLFAMLAGRPICQWLLGGWNRLASWRKYPKWKLQPHIPWLAAANGAFLGTLTHIPLDATMHADMRPWFPFGEHNGLLYTLPMHGVYQGCFWLGVVGALWIAARLAGSRLYR